MKTPLVQAVFFSLIVIFSIPACSGGVIRDMLERRREARENEKQTNLPSGVETRSLTVNGHGRSYLIYVPKTYSGKPVPLVMVFHGGGGNAEQIMDTSGWNAEAEKHGWLVAYPNGSGKRQDKHLTWNAGRCCGYAQENNVDDVAFARAVVRDIGNKFKLNGTRVYATGISNGAMLTYRLACEMSDQIAAIAPISGTQETSACRPSKPVSIIHFHGTADQNVPFEGGYGDKAFIKIEKRSVPSTLDEWESHNKCQPKEQVQVKGDSTFSSVECVNSSDIVLVKIDGGGHAWPGSTVPTRSGETSSKSINATAEMANFFKEHTH